MGYSLTDWLMRGRRVAARIHWKFEIDRSGAPARVAWRWERRRPDGTAERSVAAFESFADCARDAQSHGFTDCHAYTLSDRPSVPACAWAGPRRENAARPDVAG